MLEYRASGYPSVTVFVSVYTRAAKLERCDIFSRMLHFSAFDRGYKCVCSARVSARHCSPPDDNTIMRSYQYSSHRPEPGGVLIEMILGPSEIKHIYSNTYSGTLGITFQNGSIRPLHNGAPVTNCV